MTFLMKTTILQATCLCTEQQQSCFSNFSASYSMINKTFINTDSKIILKLYQSLVRPNLNTVYMHGSHIWRRTLTC